MTTQDTIGYQATDVVEQCPYCTYIFYKHINTELIKCPRCQSLLGMEENHPDLNLKGKRRGS